MERTVVIYKSKYGATAQYAQWIAEELSCDLVRAEDFHGRDFAAYDNIIFGGGVQAGGIRGFELIRRSRRKLAGKKVVIFAVGLNVENQESRVLLREINLNKRALRGLTMYYCAGAFDPKRIGGVDRVIIAMTLRMLRNMKSGEESALLERLYHDMTEGANYVDKRYIAPIVAEFQV